MIIDFSKNGGGGSSYVLSAATDSTLGGIMVGSGLSITSAGTLSADGVDLSDYAKEEELSGYVQTQAMSAYQTTQGMSGYVETSALTDYATNESLSAYQTTQGMSGYQTTDAMSAYQTTQAMSAYQTTQAMSGYQTTDAMSAYQTTQAMSGYQESGDYVTFEDYADDENYGVVKIGDGLTVEDGVISVDGGGSTSDLEDSDEMLTPYEGGDDTESTLGIIRDYNGRLVRATKRWLETVYDTLEYRPSEMMMLSYDDGNVAAISFLNDFLTLSEPYNKADVPLFSNGKQIQYTEIGETYIIDDFHVDFDLDGDIYNAYLGWNYDDDEEKFGIYMICSDLDYSYFVDVRTLGKDNYEVSFNDDSDNYTFHVYYMTEGVYGIVCLDGEENIVPFELYNEYEIGGGSATVEKSTPLTWGTLQLGNGIGLDVNDSDDGQGVVFGVSAGENYVFGNSEGASDNGGAKALNNYYTQYDLQISDDYENAIQLINDDSYGIIKMKVYMNADNFQDGIIANFTMNNGKYFRLFVTGGTPYAGCAGGFVGKSEEIQFHGETDHPYRNITVRFEGTDITLYDEYSDGAIAEINDASFDDITAIQLFDRNNEMGDTGIGTISINDTDYIKPTFEYDGDSVDNVGFVLRKRSYCIYS